MTVKAVPMTDLLNKCDDIYTTVMIVAQRVKQIIDQREIPIEDIDEVEDSIQFFEPEIKIDDLEKPMVEALQEYRNNGLSYWQYVYCKNYALNNFVPDFVNMLLHKKSSGYTYIKPTKLLIELFLYPNFYLSFFYFIGSRIRRLFERIANIFVS